MNTVIDEELLQVVRLASGRPDATLARASTPLTGGFWAELVTFRLVGDDDDLVARFMPDAATAAKETCIQRTVAELGFPTPAVRLWGGPDVGRGRAFMVMDRVEGRALLADLDGVAAIRRLPTLARDIPRLLGSTMADLHRLDAGVIAAALAEADIQVTTVSRLAEHLEGTAAAYGRDDLVASARWLLDRPPVVSDAVVCHGDLHPFNVLLDDSGAPVVLDWSASLLAPREYDVAFTELLLSDPPLAVPPALRPVIGAAGRLLAQRFRRGYVVASGVELDHESLRWHRALLYLRSLVEVAGWVASDDVEAHAGHPWLTLGPAFASRLASTTGAVVRPR